MPTKSHTTYHGASLYNVVNRTTGAVYKTYGEASPGIVGYANTRTWVQTPGYHEKVAAGEELPVNPYSAREISVSRPSGGTLKNVNCGYDLVGTVWRPSWVLGANSNDPRNGKSWETDAVSMAKQKLLLSVGDQKANLLVTFAEAKQTVGMITELAKRTNDAFVAVRKGKYQLASDLLHFKPVWSLRNDWLAYRYGWTPLVLETHGLAEACSKMTSGYFRTGWPFKASHEASYSGSMNPPVRPLYSYNTNFTPSIGGTASWSVSVRGTAGAWARPNRHALHYASMVGLTNPALVAWELVPYSFLFDWFVNVGGFLQAQSALDGISITRGFSGSKSSLDISGYVHPVSVSSSNCKSYTGSGAGIKIRDTSYSRTPWDGSLPPSLHIVNSDPLNTKRIADAVAIALGISRK